MPGGLIQLAAYGSENLYLMGNPEITFFKVVFKQHTNFSLESIEIPFSNQHNVSELSTKPTILKVKIPRFADLLSNIFLKVELPDIISSIYKKFQWCEGLGEIMVRSATLFIGGNRIETITSEWLNIYHRLNLSKEKKDLYDILIGNTSDLYNPEISGESITELFRRTFLEMPHPKDMSKSDDLINSYSELLGKVESLIDGTEVEESSKDIRDSLPRVVRDFLHLLENVKTLQTSNSPYYIPDDVIQNNITLKPTIESKQLYIPLPFFFSKNIGLSLPLIALQYQDIEIQIEFTPIYYLFTVLDWEPQLGRYLRKRPNPLKETQRLSYYVYSQIPIHLPNINNNNDNMNDNMNDINNNSNDENIQVIQDDDENKVNGPDNKMLKLEHVIQNSYNNDKFIFNLSLEAGFIFLDEDERRLFANQSHEYLIEQVTFRNEEGYHGKKSHLEMSLYNPVKEIIWILKRSDSEQFNIWFNYTNNLVNNIDRQLGNIFPNPYYGSPNDITIKHQIETIKSEILTRGKIMFNGIDRFDYKDSTFLSYLQPYLYHSNSGNGIYMFSFSLEPERYQPSGSVNMSMISKVTLDFETIVPPIDPDISQVLKNKADPITTAHIRNSFGLQLEEISNSNNPLSYITDKEIFQYTYNLNIYIVNYNILKIMGGMAGLAYTN